MKANLSTQTLIRCGTALAGAAAIFGTPHAFAQDADNATQATTPAAGDTAAQDAQSSEPEIVVQGFRSSLAAALSEKRRSTASVDVIKSEDIAKFPDTNLAESLQRVPGVTIARDQGEGRNISVRGLGPQFTRVRLNGMEAIATSSGFQEGVSRSRGFDFNVFAPELFNELTVRKTPSAEVEEGSLGATVDLHTGRPFDYKKLTIAGSAKVGYSDLGNNFDPRGAFLIADTFANGTLGFLLSGAYSKSSKVGEGSNSGQWDTMASNGGFCDPTRTPTATNPNPCFGQPPTGISIDQLKSNSIYHPRFPRVGRFQVTTEKIGLTGAVQWAPSDRTEIILDGTYSKQNAERRNYWLTPIGFSRAGSQQGKPEMIIRNAEVRDNTLVYAEIDNVDLRTELELFQYSTTFYQFGGELKHAFSDSFRMNAKGGTSISKFDQPLELTLQADRINSQDFVIDLRQNQKLPLLQWNFDTTNPANYYVGPVVKSPYSNPASPTTGLTGPDIRIRPQYVENKFTQGEINFEGDVNDNIKLKVGGNYRRYTFDSDALRLASETATPALPAGTTTADLLKLVEGPTHLGLPSGTATSWVGPDEKAFDKVFGIFSNTGVFALRRDLASARSNIRSVAEKDFATYVQSDFTFPAGSWTIRGDVGVRYVHTRQSSTGYQEAGATALQLTVDRSYEDFLPAANLVIQPSDSLLFRLAASKVMTRPDLTSLTPGGSVTVSGGSRTISSGNPQLNPIRANTFDAAIEWYFAPQSLLSAAFFYKDIKTYIQTLRETRPFSSSGLPVSVLAGTGLTPDDTFDFTVPVNTRGGPLKGIEVNLQTPFRFLPGFLRNFGVLLNYTYVKSDIDYIINSATGQISSQSLVGLSQNSANGTLYYEDKKLSVRGSATYRSDYVRAVPGRANQDIDGTNATLNVDASMSYALTRNFTITLEGVNLTDEFEDQYEDSQVERWESYRHFGRQFYLGASFKF